MVLHLSLVWILFQVALLSRIHHKNLVPLIGFCEEGCQRILVYEYMHNGTLRDHIHGILQLLQTFCSVHHFLVKKLNCSVQLHIVICWPDSVKQKSLDWLSRLVIAEDAAKGETWTCLFCVLLLILCFIIDFCFSSCKLSILHDVSRPFLLAQWMQSKCDSSRCKDKQYSPWHQYESKSFRFWAF